MNTTIDTKELFIKMAVSAWDTQNTRITKLLNTLSDQQLASKTAPGRNSGIYLIGHLIAVSDGMFPLMEWGDKRYPHLENTFLKNPENDGLEKPSLAELKQYWETVNAKISDHIKSMSADEWFERHTAVSEDDFAKEPHRNKLNILINRTNHTSYHLGQLVYLNPKKAD